MQALGWARRRWAGRAGVGQARRRAQAWALGHEWGARTGAGRGDGQVRERAGRGTAGRAGARGQLGGRHALGRALGARPGQGCALGALRLVFNPVF